MKRYLTIMLFFGVVSLNAQSLHSIIVNPTGKLFDRPVSIELERSISSKISIGIRFNYLNYATYKEGTFLNEERDRVEDYFYDYNVDGYGLGIHSKYYLTNPMKGFYAGLGVDLYQGDFEYTFGNDSSRAFYNEETYWSAEFSLGYKLVIQRFVIDMSLRGFSDSVRTSLFRIRDRYEDYDSVTQFIIPSIGVGYSF